MVDRVVVAPVGEPCVPSTAGGPVQTFNDDLCNALFLMLSCGLKYWRIFLAGPAEAHQLLRWIPRLTSCCRLALGNPGERFQRQGASYPLFKGTVSRATTADSTTHTVSLSGSGTSWRRISTTR
jgi:hypothetical protein